MSRIHIELFGQFCVRRNEQVLSGFEAYKVRELFSYLLLHRQRSLSRESLASLLWPDTATAQSKKKLRQALWHLQSALGSQNELVHDRTLLVEPERVQVNIEANFWLDVAVFERAFHLVQGIAGQELDIQRAQVLQNALQLYRGPCLQYCYSDWCLYERERFQNMHLVLLDKLMDYCEAHFDYDAGLLYGMRLISYDRARERTHRRLMRLHYLNGDRAAALRQYEQCVAALGEELGVKPSKRTVALYKQILTEQLAEPQPTLSPMEAHAALKVAASPHMEMLGYLTQLQQALADLQNQVEQSIQKVEQTLNDNPQPLSPKLLQ
jgi:DNA-binding SARP family transcriptional activator